jgi:hypothetical protein
VIGYVHAETTTTVFGTNVSSAMQLNHPVAVVIPEAVAAVVEANMKVRGIAGKNLIMDDEAASTMDVTEVEAPVDGTMITLNHDTLTPTGMGERMSRPGKNIARPRIWLCL